MALSVHEVDEPRSVIQQTLDSQRMDAPLAGIFFRCRLHPIAAVRGREG
jgi:hypothetical protein